MLRIHTALSIDSKAPYTSARVMIIFLQIRLISIREKVAVIGYHKGKCYSTLGNSYSP